ncbi:hypothetical protein [Halomonas cerina]|uniref:Uncharacterized protein n=1 Tax=Halomonas cerina TaxID=447424 RepID=A0A839V1U1_9GAMM|nr:hypothetical protein [Halomonas cerina]MBB3189322.1 hypothetical protein [Halomonas cerina]
MSTPRPQMYYTAVFLRVSFQAIQRSMAGKASDGLPCWLDSQLLLMLSRELDECRDRVASRPEVHQALEDASGECTMLLSHCPGGLDSTLCHRHLDAILVALQQAIAALDAPTDAGPTRLWRSTAQHLRQGWRRLS